MWVDAHKAPEGWLWCRSVEETIHLIRLFGQDEIKVISLNHNPHEFYLHGGDYINILYWIEYSYGAEWRVPINIHSTNEMGCKEMKAVIERNGWYQV